MLIETQQVAATGAVLGGSTSGEAAELSLGGASPIHN